MQSFRIRTRVVVDYTKATAEWEQWAMMIEDCDSDTGEDSEAACGRFVDFLIGRS